MRHEEHKQRVHDQVADMLEPYICKDGEQKGFLSCDIVEAVQFLLDSHLKQAVQARESGPVPGLSVERMDAIAQLCQEHNPVTRPGRWVHGMEQLWAQWLGQEGRADGGP